VLRVSRTLSPKHTNFQSPCIQRNPPATVRNFEFLRSRYGTLHCATRWEVGSTAAASKSLRCLEFKNDILLEITCRGADAVRWIKRPAELRVACLTDKTRYGYKANHKTYAFQTRTRRTAKLTANRSSKHFLSHVQKRPQGLTRLLSKVTSETSLSKSTKLAICFNLVTMLRSRGDGSSLSTSDFSLLWITMRTWPSLIMHASN